MSVELLTGDSMTMLRTLPDASVHCCVTSPPYFGLRNYGVQGQLGLEKTPEEYVAKMVEVFREVKRVLRSDGTLWLNLGSSFASAKSLNVKPKDLIPIPWMVAMALQADGWYLRSDIIWAKSNPMPESVTDRPTKAHEYVFLLTKRARYYYDAEAVKEAGQDWGSRDRTNWTARIDSAARGQSPHNGCERGDFSTGRNLRSVWHIPPQAFPGSHFATFPEKLVEPCIKAGTSLWGVCPVCGKGWERILSTFRSFESGSGRSGNDPVGKNGVGLQGGGETGDIWRGPVVHSATRGWRPGCKCGKLVCKSCATVEPIPSTVLDCFSGAGTTGVVAVRLGRNYIGIEIKPEYQDMARRRIAATVRETDTPLLKPTVKDRTLFGDKTHDQENAVERGQVNRENPRHRPRHEAVGGSGAHNGG